MRRKANRFQCPAVATQHNRMNCSLYLPTPTQPRQARPRCRTRTTLRQGNILRAFMRTVALHLQARPERWHPCARCWVETECARLREARTWAHIHCGGDNSCKLGVHATCGPLGPGQNHGRLSHEIAVAEDVLDDKRCLTASWYESVAHAWSSGSCWKGRGVLCSTLAEVHVPSRT